MSCADQELLVDVIRDLKVWFPPEAHDKRDLPGGGSWYFIPWQLVRERLDAVVPNWEVSYTAPQYLDKYCIVMCTITILGVSRQAIGNAEIELRSGTGKNMERGIAVERAVAAAFKRACENWGIGAYLDEQGDGNPKTPKAIERRNAFIKYMQQSGDGRAALWNSQNNGTAPIRTRNDPPSKPFGIAVNKKVVPQSVAPGARQNTTKPTPATEQGQILESPSVLASYDDDMRTVAPGLADTFNTRLKNANDVTTLLSLATWLKSPPVLEALENTDLLTVLKKRLQDKSEPVLRTFDLSEVNANIGIQMGRIGWKSSQGRSHLATVYQKNSRQELTPLELIEFSKFLETHEGSALALAQA